MPSVITSPLQSFSSACLSTLLSIVFFFCFITVSCGRMKKAAFQRGKRKRGKGITTPVRSGRRFHALVVWYLEKEREDHRACERQPALFAEVPTRRGILGIAVRKEKKAFMLKALERNRNTAPCNCRKGKRRMCRDAGNDAQDTSVEVGKTS